LVKTLKTRLAGKTPFLADTKQTEDEISSELTSEPTVSASQISVAEEAIETELDQQFEADFENRDLDDGDVVEDENEATEYGDGDPPADEVDDHSPPTSGDTSDVANSLLSALPATDQVQPSYYWTWRLLKEGYRRQHVQQIRNLDTATIFSHAIRAAEEKMEAKRTWLLTPEKIEMLSQYVGQHTPDAPGDDRVPRLLAGLPSDIPMEELLYYLKST